MRGQENGDQTIGTEVLSVLREPYVAQLACAAHMTQVVQVSAILPKTAVVADHRHGRLG